jgi:hypothetical protein
MWTKTVHMVAMLQLGAGHTLRQPQAPGGRYAGRVVGSGSS